MDMQIASATKASSWHLYFGLGSALSATATGWDRVNLILAVLVHGISLFLLTVAAIQVIRNWLGRPPSNKPSRLERIGRFLILAGRTWKQTAEPWDSSTGDAE